MIEHVPAATLLGVEGHRVRVEVHVGSGLPGFTVVGLPDASCREARDRVRAAVLSSGLKWPDRKVTVNLAPTHLRKVGPGLDLAIAVAVLAASEQVRPRTLDGLAFLGELGLDGSVRSVVGLLALLDAVADLVPVVSPAGLAEARLIRADARGIATLTELVEALDGSGAWASVPAARVEPVAPSEPDLRDVQGQSIARAALEVAAAGAHHLLMTGPPGAGKTMLAERLPGLLPDLGESEALAVSRVHSAAAQLRGRVRPAPSTADAVPAPHRVARCAGGRGVERSAPGRGLAGQQRRPVPRRAR